jgi:MFS transporter, SHS family, lactate transporter
LLRCNKQSGDSGPFLDDNPAIIATAVFSLLQCRTVLRYEAAMKNRELPWWKEPTRAQWSAFVAAWAGWVLDAFDFVIFGLVAAELMEEFGVGLTAIGGSITLTLLVRLAGGFVAGWMADRWGRKLPLMLSLVWFAAFDAAIAFAPTFTWVIVLRTLFGFGMGAEWTAGTALAMENWPARSRKIASGMLQAGWPVGFFLAATVYAFVVPVWGWRALFLIAAVPALLVIPIRFMVPDEVSKVAASDRGKPVSFADLMVPEVRRMLILGTIVMALGFIVYYGLTAHYMAMLRLEHGLSAIEGALDTKLFQVGMLVGVIGAGWFANRYGIVKALTIPPLLMVPALPLYVGYVPEALPIGAFLGGLLGIGYSGLTPVLTTSLFPGHVRARAIGIVYHTGALFAAFVPTLIGELSKTSLKLSGSIALVAGIGLVSLSTAVFLLRKRISATDAIEEPAPSDAQGEPAAAARVAA